MNVCLNESGVSENASHASFQVISYNHRLSGTFQTFAFKNVHLVCVVGSLKSQDVNIFAYSSIKLAVYVLLKTAFLRCYTLTSLESVE